MLLLYYFLFKFYIRDIDVTSDTHTDDIAITNMPIKLKRLYFLVYTRTKNIYKFLLAASVISHSNLLIQFLFLFLSIMRKSQFKFNKLQSKLSEGHA